LLKVTTGAVGGVIYSYCTNKVCQNQELKTDLSGLICSEQMYIVQMNIIRDVYDKNTLMYNHP